MATVIAHNTFLQRLIGALSLDRAIYEEVEADRSATSQALLVVVASSVAAGLGFAQPDSQAMNRIIFFSLLALMTWAGWALLTFEIGTRMLPERQTRSDVGELLRTLGFAATPGMLFVFGVMPMLMVPVFAITTAWMLAAMVVAVRQALDYDGTGKAVAVCVLGLVMSVSFALVIGLAFGPTLS